MSAKGTGKFKRAGKLGMYKRQPTEVLSVSLRPASISLLNELAAAHGGAGRAIQVAVELLYKTRNNPKKLRQENDSQPCRQFSFAAFPRTVDLILRLSSMIYGSKSNVVRACIRELHDLEMQREDEDDNESLSPRLARDPEDFMG
jgi:hypothetical protein